MAKYKDQVSEATEELSESVREANRGDCRQRCCGAGAKLEICSEHL